MRRLTDQERRRLQQIGRRGSTSTVRYRRAVIAELDRIEHVIENFPDRTFAFDEFGPLGIRPTGGSCWAEQCRPDRVSATCHRTEGVTCFHGCSRSATTPCGASATDIPTGEADTALTSVLQEQARIASPVKPQH